MNAPRHLGHRVRILSQAIRQAIDRKLCDLDLTGQQSFIIRYLSERQGEVVYPKDIERRFNLTHPTVSGLLQRLESKGFLTCEPDPDDRRYKRIVLTEKAAECQKEIWQHILTIEQKQMPGSEELEVGEKVYLSGPMGQRFPVKVTAKTDTTITFDANHEMAGKELNFKIELVSVG